MMVVVLVVVMVMVMIYHTQANPDDLRKQQPRLTSPTVQPVHFIHLLSRPPPLQTHQGQCTCFQGGPLLQGPRSCPPRRVPGARI